jgi:hypothetical protein
MTLKPQLLLELPPPSGLTALRFGTAKIEAFITIGQEKRKKCEKNDTQSK